MDSNVDGRFEFGFLGFHTQKVIFAWRQVWLARWLRRSHAFVPSAVSGSLRGVHRLGDAESELPDVLAVLLGAFQFRTAQANTISNGLLTMIFSDQRNWFRLGRQSHCGTCPHPKRLVRPPVVVEADPFADGVLRMLDSLEALAVDALLLHRPDDALDHAVLLRTVRGDELLLQPVASDQCGVFGLVKIRPLSDLRRKSRGTLPSVPRLRTH